MLRNNVLIGELYGLGKPLKEYQIPVSIDRICYRFFHSIFDGLDHLDYYKNAFTVRIEL